MSGDITNSNSLDNLELRAIEQRQRIHETAEEIRSKVAAGRERLDVTNNVREHFTSVAVVSSLVAIAIGFSVGGIFRSRGGDRA
jgi:hypothetical protein